MTVDELLGWCVVANVAAADLKHFSQGTKLWVLPPQWGDGGEDLMVVGRHRGSPGPLCTMVVPRVHLTNFRVRGVYQPVVHRALTKEWKRGVPRQWESREEAEKVAGWWARDAAIHAGVRRPLKRAEFYHRLADVLPGHVLQQWAVQDVMNPKLSFELGEVFRDQHEVDAVRELRELLGTIATAGVANWADNELWPVVGTVAARTRALLSR
ncbi:hypothetical protein GCM10010178_06970 [Lentzea flava]|uniref:Uncharacterized protein n=1 Tax=Lentzea flava TaxID=103732 RepID=A0ABQ2UB50_9PSEU|nr:hypothetical protein [Lentzea flava]GGU17603.1 hypothetical protein GCM10010178_06970 [Lentzea flava]